jgi:ribosomal protein L34
MTKRTFQPRKRRQRTLVLRLMATKGGRKVLATLGQAAIGCHPSPRAPNASLKEQIGPRMARVWRLNPRRV